MGTERKNPQLASADSLRGPHVTSATVLLVTHWGKPMKEGKEKVKSRFDMGLWGQHGGGLEWGEAEALLWTESCPPNPHVEAHPPV